MQDELIIERMFLKREIGMLMVHFMKETDKEEAHKILVAINSRAKKVEEINCKLVHIEMQKKFKRMGESK